MKTWWLPVSKNRQQATQALSKAEKNLKHVVSTACKPGVFRIALFKGFPNMPHIPPPTGHSAGTNETTKAPTPENAPCWHETARPREIYVYKYNSGAHLLALARNPWCVLWSHIA